MYPDIFESASVLSFMIRLPSTCIRRIRQRIPIFVNPLSMNTLRVDAGIFKSGKENVADSEISGYVWTGP